MLPSASLTTALPNDGDTKTTAYNMGCGIVAIEQYDPTAKRTNSVILTKEDLAQVRKLIGG